MKKLANPKILIPLVIVLIALGAFTAATMTGGSDAAGDSSHSHEEEHGHEH